MPNEQNDNMKKKVDNLLARSLNGETTVLSGVAFDEYNKSLERLKGQSALNGDKLSEKDLDIRAKSMTLDNLSEDITKTLAKNSINSEDKKSIVNLVLNLFREGGITAIVTDLFTDGDSVLFKTIKDFATNRNGRTVGEIAGEHIQNRNFEQLAATYKLDKDKLLQSINAAPLEEVAIKPKKIPPEVEAAAADAGKGAKGAGTGNPQAANRGEDKSPPPPPALEQESASQDKGR